jgi:erythromycin esterase-like protein
MTVDMLVAARPRVLALGEPTHGEDSLLEARNDLFRQFVERAGYRTIAIESDCLKGRIVDDFVLSGAGTLDQAMAEGFSHEWGAFGGNRELVRWLRAYNRSRPAPERVSFAGFDGPLEIGAAASPRAALLGLHAELAAGLRPCTAETLDRLLGADDRWTNPEAMMDPSRSIGRSPDAVALRLLADDLAVLAEAGTERARLFARTAVGLLRYHHWMADTSPDRMGWLLTVRDSMMAANLLALAARGPVLVSAHNSHLQRTKSSMRMGGDPVEWWGAGAVVSARLGEQYAFLATAVGTIGHRGVGAPPPDTIEGFLYGKPGDRFVVDPATLAGPAFAPRTSPWFGYAPLDPAGLARVDGVLFVKDAAGPSAVHDG